MYSDLTGVVKTNGVVSNKFPISIGLRQGCNLSPYLFNLYINDLPQLLRSTEVCDPVDLGSKQINLLMYADDMLLLSKSENGLQNALNILKEYCHKWQLVVNVDKTKVITFNQKYNDQFRFLYGNEVLETVYEYKYLGLTIHRTGTFKKAKTDLYNSALRAYFSIRSTQRHVKFTPKLEIKLFDVMVKPILLYCCEIWGAFDINKKHCPDLANHILQNDQSSYEKLNIRLCKQALSLPRSASNFGSRAELGRMPISKSIMVAICKYFYRLQHVKQSDLLYFALESQRSISTERATNLSYVEVANILANSFGMHYVTCDQKVNVKAFGQKLKYNIVQYYLSWSKANVSSLADTKLKIYALIKKGYAYENYLDCQGFASLTRFRLSCHWLPIERGRYIRPAVPREERICMLCKQAVGTEFHGLFKCTNPQLTNLRTKYLNIMCNIKKQLSRFDDCQRFLYILSCKDQALNPIACQWIDDVNHLYKEASSKYK